MPAIGITGGVASGKSTFTRCLRRLAPEAIFFDADAVARDLTGQPDVRAELRAEFGDSVFGESGSLNRSALRAIVFSDSSKKFALEQILHPRIRAEWSALAETHRNSSQFFFADIPLLYETGGETLCDLVVVVACSDRAQLDRLKERSSISEMQALEIIKSQMQLSEKIKRANHLAWNNGPASVLESQASALLELWRRKYV